MSDLAVPDLFETVVQFFRSKEWPYVETEMADVIQVPFRGENGEWSAYARVRRKQGQIAFYSLLPLTVPESKHVAMAMLLTQINFGLIIGNFEFDFEEGSVRYKTSISAQGVTIPSTLIEQMIYANGAAVDQFLPQIRAVLETD